MGEYSVESLDKRLERPCGLTKNPYALDRTHQDQVPVRLAVYANLSAVSIGTETDGSIVSPSSLNGIVGIKPTVGLVSRTGIVPIPIPKIPPVRWDAR